MRKCPAPVFPDEMRQAAKLLLRAYDQNFTARNLAMKLNTLAEQSVPAAVLEALRVSQTNADYRLKLIQGFERAGLFKRLWIAFKGTL